MSAEPRGTALAMCIIDFGIQYDDSKDWGDAMLGEASTSPSFFA
jgi:hypothetical protein